jgi:hypothetical protein
MPVADLLECRDCALKGVLRGRLDEAKAPGIHAIPWDTT